MSNTKQQIEEMLNKVSEYNKLSGKGHGDLKDNCYICGISPSGLIEAIDRLVTEARIDPFDFVESCEPECTPERHAYHQGQWDMAGRIAELQSQLTNKDTK